MTSELLVNFATDANAITPDNFFILHSAARGRSKTPGTVCEAFFSLQGESTWGSTDRTFRISIQLLYGQFWSMHVRLGIPASQSNGLHRFKSSNATLFRSLLAAFGMKKRVVCSTYLRSLIDMIAYVANSSGN